MVKSKSTLYRLMLLGLYLAILGGCVSAPVKTDFLVWPLPPEDPRIVYLESHKGEADYVEKGLFDIIFGTPPLAPFGKPFGVTARGDRIYVSLTARPSIAVIDTREKKVDYIGEFGAGAVGLPLGLGVAADDMLYVADAKSKRVFGYDAKGKLRIAIGKDGEFQNPAGVAVNNELGRIYIVDSRAHTAHAYSLAGKFLFQFGKRGDGDGELNFPTHIAIDRRNGNIIIADTANFRVQIFDKDGKFIRKFGQVGDLPGSFARPKGIGVDSEGHIYVADGFFHNFQIFDENGQLLLFVGKGGDSPGDFTLPIGMFVDEQDRIYVVDSLNGRVQVFQYLSELWKKAHPEEYKKYLLQTEGLGQQPVKKEPQ